MAEVDSVVTLPSSRVAWEVVEVLDSPSVMPMKSSDNSSEAAILLLISSTTISASQEWEWADAVVKTDREAIEGETHSACLAMTTTSSEEASADLGAAACSSR